MSSNAKVKYRIALWWHGQTDGRSEKRRLYVEVSQDPLEVEPISRRLIDLIYKKVQEVMPEDMVLARFADGNGEDLLTPEVESQIAEGFSG